MSGELEIFPAGLVQDKLVRRHQLIRELYLARSEMEETIRVNCWGAAAHLARRVEEACWELRKIDLGLDDVQPELPLGHEKLHDRYDHQLLLAVR